ncbi:MAG: sugar transferase [Lachnospiraceae bacterium]|nr:sugar transferase [Lachnospiraceae bacterium]
MKQYRKKGFYERIIKRAIDIICSLLALLVFGWLYIIVAILVKTKLGSPVLFKQIRPGIIDNKTGEEKLFTLYKFRTMTDEKDENGKFLPDEIRLTKFGKMLRATSLDELPEVFNILNGTMTIIGPRPQLVRDMVFMDDKQRLRHTARPGLSGLAQISGRNGITWENKFKYDLEYISKISFPEDVKIVFMTVMKAFIKKEGITEEGYATAADYGDYLLKTGKVSQDEYDKKQEIALELLRNYKNNN